MTGWLLELVMQVDFRPLHCLQQPGTDRQTDRQNRAVYNATLFTRRRRRRGRRRRRRQRQRRQRRLSTPLVVATIVGRRRRQSGRVTCPEGWLYGCMAAESCSAPGGYITCCPSPPYDVIGRDYYQRMRIMLILSRGGKTKTTTCCRKPALAGLTES